MQNLGARTQKAKNDLLTRFSVLGSWKQIEDDTGIDRSYLRRVALGKCPASRKLFKALGLNPKPKPRKNWKRKESLLRKAYRRLAEKLNGEAK
jgi:hypothetical protein